MSLPFPEIKPIEQILAIGAAGLAIRKAGAGNPAKIIAAANTALKVAAAFNTAGSGDVAGALGQVEALTSDPKMDPTVALGLQGLFGIAENLSQIQAEASQMIPVISRDADGVLTSIGKGITQVANAYIAKNQPPAVLPANTGNLAAAPVAK